MLRCQRPTGERRVRLEPVRGVRPVATLELRSCGTLTANTQACAPHYRQQSANMIPHVTPRRKRRPAVFWAVYLNNSLASALSFQCEGFCLAERRSSSLERAQICFTLTVDVAHSEISITVSSFFWRRKRNAKGIQHPPKPCALL